MILLAIFMDARRVLCLITIIITKHLIVLMNRFKINANSESILIFVTDIKRNVENTSGVNFQPIAYENIPYGRILKISYLVCVWIYTGM